MSESLPLQRDRKPSAFLAIFWGGLASSAHLDSFARHRPGGAPVLRGLAHRTPGGVPRAAQLSQGVKNSTLIQKRTVKSDGATGIR